jgi:DNA-binding NtrC family response regulator
MNVLSGKSILVVDDDEFLREVLGDIFRLQKCLVSEADSGDSALEKIKAQHFDVVLTDVRMPGGDGITLAAEIQKLPAPRPLVFICSGFNDLTPEMAKKLDILKAFEKPFGHQELIKVISSHLLKQEPTNLTSKA